MRLRLKSVSLSLLLVGSIVVALPVRTLITHLPVLAQTTTQDRKAEADRLLEQGIEQYETNQYKAAIHSWEYALTIYRKIQDGIGESTTLSNIGLAYRRLSQYLQAFEYYQKALEVFRKIQNPSGEATTLNNIGLVENDLGQYSQAITKFQQSLAIFQKIGDSAGKSAVFNNLGLTYQNLGEYDKALYFFQQAQVTSKKLDNAWNRRVVLINLGQVYRTVNQCSKALEFYQQALEINSVIKDRNGEAIILSNIASAYECLKEYSKATQYYEESLAIFREVGDHNREAIVLSNLGNIYVSLNQSHQSFELYHQALQLFRILEDREGEHITLSNIGFILAEQQPEIAIVFYKQSINVVESIRTGIKLLSRELQISYTQTVAGTYRVLADLLLAKGRILEAQQVLELLKVEELKDFDQATRAKITNGKIELDPIERVIVEKFGSFVNFGQKLRECQEWKDGCSDAEKDQLVKLRIAANQEYDQAVKTFAAAIKQREQEDKESFLNPKNDLNREAQKIIEAQPNTAIIYSLVTDNKFWLVLVSKGEALRQFEVTVSQQELNGAVLKFRQLMEQCEKRPCTTKDKTELNAVSQQLYSWMFPKPLQEELQRGKIKHLVFAQDRMTRYIPMAALFDGNQYLIENFTVSTIVSAKFTNVDRPNFSPQTTLVLGAGLSNPAPPDFPALKSVPIELAAIVQDKSVGTKGIFPGLELLNEKFDFFSLQKNLYGHTILHIATHGAFVREQSDASFILLGNGKKLPISEIRTLNDLGKVHLVTLSACQTALADRDANGVEIANVSYSFFEAGVSSVIASLWQVNDISTSLLMQEFYSRLSKGDVTKAEALQQVQVEFLKGKLTTKDVALRASARPLFPPGLQQAINSSADFSHPYYWAPFILIGNSL